MAGVCLRTFYEDFIRTLRRFVSNEVGREIPGNVKSGVSNRTWRLKMLVVAIMSLLCAGGIAFYTRFLLALCRECEPQVIGYWARLRFTRRVPPSAAGKEQRQRLVRTA
jgi:hypothetical protein